MSLLAKGNLMMSLSWLKGAVLFIVSGFLGSKSIEPPSPLCQSRLSLHIMCWRPASAKAAVNGLSLTALALFKLTSVWGIRDANAARLVKLHTVQSGQSNTWCCRTRCASANTVMVQQTLCHC